MLYVELNCSDACHQSKTLLSFVFPTFFPLPPSPFPLLSPLFLLSFLFLAFLSLPSLSPSYSHPSHSFSLCSLQPSGEERGNHQHEEVSELQALLSELTSELSTLRAEYEQLETSKRRQGENYKRIISELKEELVEVSGRQTPVCSSFCLLIHCLLNGHILTNLN